MAKPEQKVYTQAEIEAVEIADSLGAFLLDNYGDYPIRTTLMALAIHATVLTQAIDQEIERRRKHDERRN